IAEPDPRVWTSLGIFWPARPRTHRAVQWIADKAADSRRRSAGWIEPEPNRGSEFIRERPVRSARINRLHGRIANEFAPTVDLRDFKNTKCTKPAASCEGAGFGVLPEAGSAAVTTAEVIDQALGRSVFGRGFFRADKAAVDAFAELLAQFHAPLVEGVGAPDHALHEHFVLVHGDERTQAARADALADDGVARTVTRHDLVWRNALNFVFRQALGTQLGLGFFASLAQHQCLALREAVGVQPLMV
nr:hypothetical protein [Tanacetum cinerariifolium]